VTTPQPYVVHWSGARFALGEGAEGYLILDSGQFGPGPVRLVQAFERSPAGWAQAFATFSQWERAPRPATPGGPNGTQLIPSPQPGPPLMGAPPGFGVPPVQWNPYAPSPQPSGVGVSGGVVGIVGTVLSLIPLIGIVLGLLLGPIAIVLSSVGLAQSSPGPGRPPRPKGMAITGLVLGILTVVFKLIPGVNLL
jgi:hypothetical protein